LSIGLGEIMVCLIVAILVLKPTDMVKVATQTGKTVRKLKRMWQGLQDDIHKITVQPINRDLDE